MATVYFDHDNLPVVSYYCRLTHKAKKVPRAQLRKANLIGEPYEVIKAWAEKNYPSERTLTASQFVAPAPGSILHLIEKFYQSSLNDGMNAKTFSGHKKYLEDYAIPFFTQMEPRKPKPQDWWEKSALLSEFVLLQSQSPHVAQKTNTALSKFFEWLKVHYPKEFRHVPAPHLKKVHRPKVHTVLKFTLSPGEVLERLTEEHQDVRLIGLIGFFSNLRPQEIFALRPSDFIVGGKVEGQELECSKVMREHGLFSKLSISVKGQRTQLDSNKENREKNKTSAPKSIAALTFVSVWDERAAKEIAKIIRTKPTHEPLFKIHNDTLFDRWADYGLAGTTIKDLRRAGIYYLGHHTSFRQDIAGLKAHARHEKIDTTFLYMRRPKPQDVHAENNWDDLLN
jgi:hypothetical protein